MTDQLAARRTVTELVHVYETAVADIRGAFARVCAAEAALNGAFTLAGTGSIQASRAARHVDFGNPSDVLLDIRHQCWSAIVERLEVRRMMSVARAKELDRQIERRELPEITVESVTQLVEGFRSSLRPMLEEAVDEVFEWLRPHHSAYKTNTELENRLVDRKKVLTTPARGLMVLSSVGDNRAEPGGPGLLQTGGSNVRSSGPHPRRLERGARVQRGGPRGL